MQNRDRQWVTADEVDADLRNLGLISRGPGPNIGFAVPQTDGERTLARFFFVHRARAVRDGQDLYTYEFLHATFAEFLAARLVVQILAEVVVRNLASAHTLRPQPAHDDLLYSLLSFGPLTGQGATTLGFVAELVTAESGQASIAWLRRAFQLATTRLDVPRDDYLPARIPAGQRLTRYGLNLVLLAVAAGDSVEASALFPEDPDPADRLGRTAHGWQSTLSREQWRALISTLKVKQCWTGARRDIMVGFHSERADFDAFWLHEYGPDSEIWSWPRGSGFDAADSTEEIADAIALRADPGEAMLDHALGPMRELLDPAITSFVIHGPQYAESVARSLIRAWLTAAYPEPPGSLEDAFDVLVSAATGKAWGQGQHPTGMATVSITLETLLMCVDRLPREAVERWLLQIVQCDQFTNEHIALAANCMVRCDRAGMPEVEEWLAGSDYAGRSARYQVMELIAIAELPDRADDMLFDLTEDQIEALRGDRGLAHRYRALGFALPGD